MVADAEVAEPVRCAESCSTGEEKSKPASVAIQRPTSARAIEHGERGRRVARQRRRPDDERADDREHDEQARQHQRTATKTTTRTATEAATTSAYDREQARLQARGPVGDLLDAGADLPERALHDGLLDALSQPVASDLRGPREEHVVDLVEVELLREHRPQRAGRDDLAALPEGEPGDEAAEDADVTATTLVS